MKSLTKTVLFLFSIILFSCEPTPKKIENVNNQNSIAEFTGSNSCVSCHSEEYKNWKGSHHDNSMKIADSTSVLANFNETEFESKDIIHAFFKKGKDFYVNTIGPDGEYHDYKIEYTFGFSPLQQYIVKFPNGEFQCLETAWDTEKKEWFSLQPDLEIKHKEWIHWTGGGMRWNTMCADCHSTNLQKNYDNNSDTYNTTFSEINVSCESCHGPASNHISFYEEKKKGTTPLLSMQSNLKSKELVDACARCHSRRSQKTDYYNYKGEFLDHYYPALLTPDIYELDGQIKDEDYVYGSFVQSKMYHNGVSCKDCHDVHSLKLKKEGNNLCLQCHEQSYNSKNHHFHSPTSESGQCINCHMTGKTYMENDFRRDHSFRVPRPDQSEKYGTSNACTECHKYKSNKWASDFIISKYETERVDHFSDHLIKGNLGDKAAYQHLFTNTKYPAIARATAINQYLNTNVTIEEINQLKSFLKDSSALVRNEVISVFEQVGLPDYKSLIQPMLSDSIRSVRISAARYFNITNQKPIVDSEFTIANQEYLNSVNFNADYASGQLEIALNHQSKGNNDLAIKAYEKSIEMDNYFNPSKMNLALLYYQKGEIKKAEDLYLKVIEQEPDFDQSYYMLGLLYNEIKNTGKSIEYLAKAFDINNYNVNAAYNLSLILQQTNDIIKANEIIAKALKTSPYNERLLNSKLSLEMNRNDKREALKTITILLNINPNNQKYQQIYSQLQ